MHSNFHTKTIHANTFTCIKSLTPFYTHTHTVKCVLVGLTSVVVVVGRLHRVRVGQTAASFSCCFFSHRLSASCCHSPFVFGEGRHPLVTARLSQLGCFLRSGHLFSGPLRSQPRLPPAAERSAPRQLGVNALDVFRCLLGFSSCGRLVRAELSSSFSGSSSIGSSPFPTLPRSLSLPPFILFLSLRHVSALSSISS